MKTYELMNMHILNLMTVTHFKEHSTGKKVTGDGIVIGCEVQFLCIRFMSAFILSQPYLGCVYSPPCNSGPDCDCCTSSGEARLLQAGLVCSDWQNIVLFPQPRGQGKTSCELPVFFGTYDVICAVSPSKV